MSEHHYSECELKEKDNMSWMSICDGPVEPYFNDNTFYYSNSIKNYHKDGKKYWVWED